MNCYNKVLKKTLTNLNKPRAYKKDFTVYNPVPSGRIRGHVLQESLYGVCLVSDNEIKGKLHVPILLASKPMFCFRLIRNGS